MLHAALIDFQASILAAGDQDGALREAVRRAVNLFDAQLGAVVRGDAVVCATDPRAAGAARSAPPATVADVALEDEEASRLVVVRPERPFTEDELDVARGMARLLGLSLRLHATAARESALRSVSEQQAREVALLASFRSAFEDSGDGAALVTAEGRVSRVNRALCDILGTCPEAVAGRPFGELVPPTEGAPDGLAQVLDGSRLRVAEERRFAHTRGERWLGLTFSPVVGDDPDSRYVVVRVQDVTERKRAELALRDSEERFRTAFEETNIGMAILDADGVLLRINPALEQRILGYDTEELVGRHCFDITHPDDRADDLQAVRRLHGECSSLEHERRYRHRNGYWVWCLANISAVRQDGEIRQFVIQIEDITQRRVIEQFVRESEARYRSLVEHLPLVTYRDRLDADSSNLYSSPQIIDLLGHPMQDWIDDPTMFCRIVHPDDRERVMAEVQRCNETLETFACEFRTVAADGRVATVYKEGVVVFDDHGQPLYRQGYLLDVTERRGLEEQLRLAQKLESVGQLAAGIAHEINTPIQFVGDSVAFVREATEDLFSLVTAYREIVDSLSGPPAEAARATAERAEDEADLEYLEERLPGAFQRTADGIERVAAIVRAMKAFAHPSTDAHAPVDINESVRTTLVVAKAEYKYVADVVLDLDESIPLVSADAGELNQVLLNLVVNAGHAIAEALADESDRGTITISTHALDAHVAVAVRDTGCGIPDEIRDRIFDPFYTTKEVGRGTGQGLAIARSIVVDKHGGRIEVDSTPGAGTTMTVLLPLRGAAATAAAPTFAEAA